MISEELLQEAKSYLDITWELDAGERTKLSGILERGMAALSGRLGPCDFETNGEEKELLFCYAMYARAGAVDEFWNNYRSSIVSLQIHKWAMKAGEGSCG